MEANDILLDSDGDLLIENGDFKIGPSDEQHIEDIISAYLGWWKEFPSVGVGIKQYQAGSGVEQTIEREIKLQLKADGYTVDRPSVEFDSSGRLVINPNAIRL
jgi:hypothetical protein